jgi:hypothetical protein
MLQGRARGGVPRYRIHRQVRLMHILLFSTTVPPSTQGDIDGWINAIRLFAATATLAFYA